jgi:hypothetical protein
MVLRLSKRPSVPVQPHWRLVHKVVIELPITAALFHDFVDLPGISNDAGPFGADAFQVREAFCSSPIITRKEDRLSVVHLTAGKIFYVSSGSCTVQQMLGEHLIERAPGEIAFGTRFSRIRKSGDRSYLLVDPFWSIRYDVGPTDFSCPFDHVGKLDTGCSQTCQRFEKV